VSSQYVQDTPTCAPGYRVAASRMVGRLASPAASSLKRDPGGYAQQNPGEK
jgi:hypothetical protein